MVLTIILASVFAGLVIGIAYDYLTTAALYSTHPHHELANRIDDFLTAWVWTPLAVALGLSAAGVLVYIFTIVAFNIFS